MLGASVGVLSDDRRSVAVFEQNGRVYRGINDAKKRIVRYEIDGKVIADERKRCDNALALPAQKVAYFVELKGEDIKKAAVQISATVQHFQNQVAGYVVHGRIVCSRVPRPDVRASQIVALERLLASMGGSLEKKSQLMEEAI